MLKTSQIQIRDPFVVACEKSGRYHLFGTTDSNPWGAPAVGFDVYISDDLERWQGPFPSFRPSRHFWADRHFWAPEVHIFNGKYYMFASFKSNTRTRGTQILLSNSLKGPYKPIGMFPITPQDWECLDGTLHLDSEGCPWMVFCHEWVQAGDGEYCAMKLSNNLTAAVSEPTLLFRASTAKWTTEYISENGIGKEINYISDGPFLYRKENGQLIMLWSSFGEKGYALGISRSQSGSVLGPWIHDEEPLFSDDGGHGMLFRTFQGRLTLTLHRPNTRTKERAVFLPIDEVSL